MTQKSIIQKNDNLEIYKLLVEMADRVSQRRQSANSFYLTVNTALIGGSSFLAQKSQSLSSILTIALAGIAVSILWVWNIQSYKTLNEAKFKVITQIEDSFQFSPFKDE